VALTPLKIERGEACERLNGKMDDQRLIFEAAGSAANSLEMTAFPTRICAFGVKSPQVRSSKDTPESASPFLFLANGVKEAAMIHTPIPGHVRVYNSFYESSRRVLYRTLAPNDTDPRRRYVQKP